MHGCTVKKTQIGRTTVVDEVVHAGVFKIFRKIHIESNLHHTSFRMDLRKGLNLATTSRDNSSGRDSFHGKDALPLQWRRRYAKLPFRIGFH